MYKLQVFSFLAFALLSFDCYSQESECNGSSHNEQRVCQAKQLQKLDDELNQAYKLALEKMPEKNDSDIRKSREQLRKSQRAWLLYSSEQCALEGGFEGGSNSWVSTFAGECMKNELSNRIKFLNSIPDSTSSDN